MHEFEGLEKASEKAVDAVEMPENGRFGDLRSVRNVFEGSGTRPPYADDRDGSREYGGFRFGIGPIGV
jgi:hypothetical protein